MSQQSKFRERLLGGRADHNIDFARLCAYLRHLDFDEDINGSHHVYGRNDVDVIIVLQPRSDGKAKAYQVKQVRRMMEDYGL